jgi:hypothetical protein
MEDILSSKCNTKTEGFGLSFGRRLGVFIWLERFVFYDFDIGRKFKFEDFLRKSEIRLYLRELKLGFVAGPIKENGFSD